MKLANIKKPFKVEFIDGPINGAIRYYSTYKIAKSVAKRYCSKPIAGRCIFTHPHCEISALCSDNKIRIIDVIM